MGIVEELKSKNFTIYAQWAGLISIILLIVCGIVHLEFAILTWILAFIIIFVEVPLCMRVCPTSSKFDNFIKIFENSYFRTIGYLLFSTSVLIVGIVEHGWWIYILTGIDLAVAGICYGIAAIKRQDHKSSSITGGSGVDLV